jgi:hypothetical protein
MDNKTGAEGFVAKHIVRQANFVIEAPREVVFPLLCPVREREWLPGWQADVIHSESGLIEDGCVFRSKNPQLGEALYVTSRYEPEAGIVEFIVFFPGVCVMKLAIAATAEGAQRTHLRWSRSYTGLDQRGNAFIDGLTEELFAQQMAAMKRALADYCQSEHRG